jgi:SAM-dependent methyltransferase
MHTQANSAGIAEHYDCYWQARVAEGRVGETAIHRAVERLVRARVLVGGSILDCGVGPGHYFRALSRDYRMFGVEVSAAAVARGEFEREQIRVADLNEGVPDFGIRFDCVIASMIIHHLSDPHAFLSSVARSLKPGGVIVISHPNLGYFRHVASRWFTGQAGGLSPAHRVFLRDRDMRRLLRETGLSVRAVTSPKRKPFPSVLSRDLIYLCNMT